MTEEKFQSIYKEYHQTVKKVVYSVLHDIDLSEDVCQEVFWQFSEKADYLDEKFYKAWFIATARRRSIDFCRKSYQIHEFTSSTTDSEEYMTENHAWISSKGLDGNLSIEDEVINKIEFQKMLEKVFEDLEKKNKEWYEICKRSFLREEKTEDIANALGISVGNLRAKKHRLRCWIYRQYGNIFRNL